jgi:hypothetical protein
MTRDDRRRTGRQRLERTAVFGKKLALEAHLRANPALIWIRRLSTARLSDRRGGVATAHKCDERYRPALHDRRLRLDLDRKDFFLAEDAEGLRFR